MAQVTEQLEKINLIIRKNSQPDVSIINELITYRNIMLEHPPKGSKFTTQEGYITPNNGHIPYKLREQTRSLRDKYIRRDLRFFRIRVNPKDFRFMGEPREGNSLKN